MVVKLFAVLLPFAGYLFLAHMHSIISDQNHNLVLATPA
jgi:hypothetical protein